MPCNGWRTLVAEKPSDFSVSDNCVEINGEKKYSFPIGQVRNIIITAPYGSLTLPLLNELSRNGISLIVCDSSRTPSYEMVNIGSQTNIAAAVLSQAKWNDERKEAAWQFIVKNKIRMQEDLLIKLGKTVPSKIKEYRNDVLPGDPTNHEGQAARIYFSSLFGSSFRRMAPDNTNAALNYGYAIIRASMDRIVTGYGYHTALGINHCSTANRFNLSCDLMEPFRPFVDSVVMEHADLPLDSIYKELLIAILQTGCTYKSIELSIEQAMDMYAHDVLTYLDGGRWEAGEVEFL